MASARKNYARQRADTAARAGQNEKMEAACFLDDLLNGRIRATRIQEVRDGLGQLVRFTYDDPNGTERITR